MIFYFFLAGAGGGGGCLGAEFWLEGLKVCVFRCRLRGLGMQIELRLRV